MTTSYQPLLTDLIDRLNEGAEYNVAELLEGVVPGMPDKRINMLMNFYNLNGVDFF